MIHQLEGANAALNQKEYPAGSNCPRITRWLQRLGALRSPAALAAVLAGACLSAQAQTTFYVGGKGVIGTSTLTTAAGVATLPVSGGHWAAAGGGGNRFSTLTSPTLTVSHAGPVTLKFTHRYNFETGWDGGAVYVNVNGAGPAYVDASAFTQNGYVAAVGLFGGLQVFNDKSPGWDTATLIQSIVNLGTLNAGDTVSLDFKGGWDDNTFPPDPNWEIGTVEVRDGANAVVLNVDFLTGTAGFSVTSDSGLEGPWVYRNNATCQFEINPSVTPNADRFATDVTGAAIDLTDAKLEVVVLAGTLKAGDTFTLFNLSGGTTLQGNYQGLKLPNGLWDVSGLAPGGNGTITVTRPVPGTVVNMNVRPDAVPNPDGIYGPIGGAGATWNKVAKDNAVGAVHGANLLDSAGAPTSVGFSVFSNGGTGDNWPVPGPLKVLEYGAWNSTDKSAGGPSYPFRVSGLISGHAYDLYIISYYQNEQGCAGTYSTTNATSNGADQPIDNGLTSAERNSTTWVPGSPGNYVVFQDIVANESGSINIDMTVAFDGSRNPKLMVNGFQLVDLTPVTTPPAAPTSLTPSVTFSQVGLTWAGAATATGYKVKRSTTSGSGYAVIGTVSSPGFTDTAVATGVTYYYVVSATNSIGESANSTQVSATPILTAPTGLTVTAGDTLVKLSWTGAAGATSYNVKRSLTSGGPYATVANLAGTSYTNTGLINNTTYYYVVSSTNSLGESANTAQVSATPVHPTNTTVGMWSFLFSQNPGWTVQRNNTLTDAGIQLGEPGVQEGMMSIARPAGMTFTNAGVEMVFVGTADPGNNTPYTYLSMYADAGNPPRYAYGIGGNNTTAVGSLDQNINTGTGETISRVAVATNFVGYHTMALVRLDDNTCNAYCDGVFVGSRATTPALLNLANLGVGANYFGGANYFPRGTVVQRVRAFTFPSGGFNVNQLWTPDSINAEKQIVAFNFGDLGAATINEAAHTIAITVPYVTDLTALAPTLSYFGASVSPESGATLNFTTPKTYTVTATNGTTQAYVVTVLNPKSSAKAMLNVFFTGLGYANPIDSTGTNLAVFVASGTPVTALAPTYEVSPYAAQDPAFPSGTIRNFTTPKTYTVTAEDGSKAYYSVAVVPVTGYLGYQALVLASGPVAYWPLDEFDSLTAVDIAGGHNADYSGTVTLGVPGLKINKGTGGDVAAYFDSTGTGTAAAPYSDSLNPAQFTVEFWSTFTNLSGAYLVSLQDRTTGSRIGYAFQKNNGGAGFQFTYGIAGNGQATLQSVTQVAVGSVYHVVATYDGTTVKMYVNGTLENSAAATYLPATTDQPGFTIGSRNSVTPVNGVMQDVALYNRALTAQEIQTHTQNAPILQVGNSGGKVVLTWVPGGGGLQAAPAVTGTYTNVPAATSPYTNTPSAGSTFWRVKF